jgi:plastocyanin
MKSNLYYVGILAAALLVLSGPASFATPTDPTQLTETTDQTETSPEGIVTVAIGEGSNATVQHYIYDPQTVEINAGESVTWFASGELVDFHTVTFLDFDQNVRMELLEPFAVPEDTDFELSPPFNVGEPLTIPTPDGREAIIAAPKQAWYPSVVDANDQTTYLNGTDIEYTMNATEKVINSGIIQPPIPPTAEAADQNTTATDVEGEVREIPGAAVTNETTTTGNATTDTPMPPEDEATSQAVEEEGGQPPMFPFPLVSSFTVTFEEPGTYPYLCIVHPWMTGQVIVQGDTQTETQGQNQTETGTQPPANETTTTTPDDQDVPLSDPDADRPTTSPEAQTETPGPGEQQSPNPIFG